MSFLHGRRCLGRSSFVLHLHSLLRTLVVAMQWIDFEALIFARGAVQDGNFNITKSIANSHDLFPLNVPIPSMLLFRQSLFVDVTATSTVDYLYTQFFHFTFTGLSDRNSYYYPLPGIGLSLTMTKSLISRSESALHSTTQHRSAPTELLATR
jgi:hypothetical protein